MSELDRKKPFSEVQGDSLASFYQGGKYFDSNYQEISAEDASKPSKGGSFVNQVEAGVAERMAQINAKKPLTLVDTSNPSTNRQADIDAARARSTKREQEPVAVEPSTDARYDTLSAMHISKLRELVNAAGLTPVTGLGSKAKNIALLLENTE